MFKFSLFFFIDITPVISSIKIILHVCITYTSISFTWSTEKLLKIRAVKTFNMYFNKKLILYCIFEANKHI